MAEANAALLEREKKKGKKKLTAQEKVEEQQDRVAILEKRKRREVAEEKKAEQNSGHWEKVLAEAVEEWQRADKRKDAAGREKAKEKAQRAQRKLSFWLEQEDLEENDVEDIVRRLRRQRRKLEFLKDERDEAEVPTSGVVVPSAPWNPYHRPIAAWIVPWLERSWEAGWRGVVNSGWRDPIYSEGLCIRMCGQPQCPGMCAGRASGHSQSTYPGGCIDVSDYWDFAAIQRRVGSPLRNDLPSDRVHFSVTGH